MWTLHVAFFLYFLVLVAGLLSALAARLGEGSRHQTTCQWAFLICLGLVGATTIVTLAGAPGAWLGAGATFSVMVVGTTCDFSRSRRAAT
jgi:hypothetical protein